MAIGTARPEFVAESFVKLFGGSRCPFGFCRFTNQISLFGIIFKRSGIPDLTKCLHVGIVAPVSPIPGTRAIFNETVVFDFPLVNITLCGREYILNCCGIARSHIIIPVSETHERHGLLRQFLFPVSFGHGGIHYGIRALPVGKFACTFACQ